MPRAEPTDPPALTLVVGPEDLLVDRAVAGLVRAARALDVDTDVRELEAAGMAPGTVTGHTSPSLFGERTVIVVRGVQDAADALAQELAEVCATAGRGELDGVHVVLVHKGGQRGKKLLEAARKAGAHEIACKEVKWDSDKSRFVEGEFRAARRRVTPEAVRALVDAVGSDLRELAAACAQLAADTEGVVDAGVVDRYHGGRVEASGFKVADAAIEGRCEDALSLVRHALATGVDPVPINAALGAGLRAVVKVAGARRGSPEELARELGMAPFQVKKARGQLRGWSPEGIAAAIDAVAWADAQIKGAGADPLYALERTVVAVARARTPRDS
ncbi:MAG TPA: DNA polymerase III subunit delta [Actinomycetes bacterium]|nr:DNA polymerase III subunit delta [Actinomycetes bacterium]